MNTTTKATNTSPRAKASTSAPALGPSQATPKGNKLDMPLNGRTRDQIMARLAVDGVVGNGRSLVDFGASFGELSLTECVKVLTSTAQGFNDGDLSAAVTMLAAQAVALNAMFGELARRAALNMGEHLDAADRYMRLALKAQGQSRATLETLAAIKNPPVVFARQANINNGGQQQVNNGTAAEKENGTLHTGAHAHAANSFQPNELLVEDSMNGSTKLDARATAEAGGANQRVEPVGAVNRAANR